MINLSITLMLIGVGGIVVSVLTHIVKELWEEWKAGFKKRCVIRSSVFNTYDFHSDWRYFICNI